MGRYDLGLTSGEFWVLTPKEFYELGLRHRVRIEREEYGTALIASFIADFGRDEKEDPEPWTADDFMPSRAAKRAMERKAAKAEREKPADWRVLLRKVVIMNAALGGTDQRERR